jgi:hypothetical protein
MPTTITLTADNVVIPAVLNDTTAAQNFKKRLPLKLSGYRSEVDYCCHAACGIFDPAQTQSGWKNGDISLAGGWFAVFIDGEERSKDYHGLMVIAHLEPEALEQVRALPESVRFTIELA